MRQAGARKFSAHSAATITTDELLAIVDDLNRRDDVDGILVQMPLPRQVDAKRILDAVDPAKDVDGFHPVNVGHLVAGRPALVACTPAGVMEILRRSGIPLEGANAVVIGRSDIVGKPMALLLLHANATVTICHSKTRDLPEMARRADIVVAAMGRAAMVTPDFVRPGATVIDVGQNVITDARRSRANFREFSGKARIVPREGFGAGGRRSSRRDSDRRRVHARARRRGPADHRDADEQHRAGGAHASWPACSCWLRRSIVMLRVGLTGGIASGKSTVASLIRDADGMVLEPIRWATSCSSRAKRRTTKSCASSAARFWRRAARWIAANWARSCLPMRRSARGSTRFSIRAFSTLRGNGSRRIDRAGWPGHLRSWKRR